MPLSNSGALVFVAAALAFFVLLWGIIRGLYEKSGVIGRVGSHVRGYYEAPTSRRWRGALESRFPRGWPFVENRFDPGRFRGLPLTLLLLAAAYVAFLFVGLVEEVMESEEIDAIDDFIVAAVVPLRNPILVQAFTKLTVFASMETLTAVAIVSTAFLWARGPLWGIPALWVCVLGSQVTTWSGKFLINRTRPDFILDVSAASPSFPSGHATGAMAVYGIIAYVVSRDLASHRRRLDVIYWTAVLILLLAFSRVYLSVHFPSDIGAGLLVGGFWVLAGIVVAETLRDREDVPT
ncbi:phosphatase PAP2 family protein [Microbaculum marinum]|uniref:Phosphatase PAP2 family protein n=1 Tax=Microbaculum marinum TaxID=1764581 RepID=A0AAW9RRR3_9HYPH